MSIKLFKPAQAYGIKCIVPKDDEFFFLNKEGTELYLHPDLENEFGYTWKEGKEGASLWQSEQQAENNAIVATAKFNFKVVTCLLRAMRIIGGRLNAYE